MMFHVLSIETLLIHTITSFSIEIRNMIWLSYNIPRGNRVRRRSSSLSDVQRTTDFSCSREHDTPISQ